MVLAGKDATADGSVLLAHNNDLTGHEAAFLERFPRRTHPPEEVVGFSSGLALPQARETYAWQVLETCARYDRGDAVAVNEYQVSIAGGVALDRDRNDRARAADPLVKSGLTGGVRYVALERSKTARECVELMGRLYTAHGITYPSGVGIADPNEVWYMEAGGGHSWAAVKVPNHCYWVQANGYRIGEIDPEDPDGVLCSPGLLSFAAQKGLWRPGKETFNFSRAFGGRKLNNPATRHYDARRVWDVMRVLSPSLALDPDAVEFPMYAVPEEKITLQKLMSEDVLRAHFKGAPYDPYRLLGRAAGERPVAVENCVHTSVIQLRGRLPADVGAVLWGGPGPSLTTPYIPFYFGITAIPVAYQSAGPAYRAESAYWAFKTLSNLLMPRDVALLDRVLAVWRDFETHALAQQASLEKTALALHAKDREAAREILTRHTTDSSLRALETARRMAGELHTAIARTGSKWINDPGG